MASRGGRVPSSSLVAFALGILVALTLWGCSSGRTVSAPSTETAETESESETTPGSEAEPVGSEAESPGAEAESLGAEGESPESEAESVASGPDAKESGAESPDSEAEPPSSGTKASAETPPPRPESTPADTTSAEGEPAPIRVKISDEERSKLVAQIEADLQVATTRASSRPDPTEVSEEQRQRWDTLDQYIELAKASWEAGDIRAASDLALKARLLADEIGSR